MNHISVILTDESGVVSENKLFFGKNAVKRAERFYAKRIRELNSDVSKDTIEDALDDGYYQFNGMTAHISWPEIFKSK